MERIEVMQKLKGVLMEEKNIGWWSPSLGCNKSLTVYGVSGTPVILIPDKEGVESGIINRLSYQLANGHNQVFCINQTLEEGLNNQEQKPDLRIIKNNQFESYLIEEVIPRIHKENSNPFIILAGLGLGAYYATNFALKHPADFGKLIAISGIFNIRSFFYPFYNDDIYYNNPIDYLPNLTDRTYLENIHKMDIRFATGNEDPNLEETYRICHILQQKSVSYQLDIWNENDPNVENHWADALLRHVV